LYVLEVNHLIGKAFPLDQIPEIKRRKLASEGAPFVYCETDRKDAGMGWFADAGNGVFREGNGGFGKLGEDWAKEHLINVEPIVGTKFRDAWDIHPELVRKQHGIIH